MSKAQPNQSFDTDTAQDPKFASSTLDFLLIELVPLAQRITEQLHTREQALLDEYKRSRIFNQSDKPQTTDTSDDGKPVAEGTEGATSTNETATNGGMPMTSIGFPALSDNGRESVFWRLDGLGYRVGQGLVER